jgi:hypothetical protein
MILDTMTTRAETPSPSPRVALLLQAYDQGYDHKSWHGPVLRGTLRGVTAEQAAWRPAPGRHNIWELAVHAAYWKYSILRRIRRMDRGSFPFPGSNWFPRPVEPGERASLRSEVSEDTAAVIRLCSRRFDLVA